ncbi:hypothetical protein EWM64_g5869 [Hericium alpestre]|uniref:B30.2/SPRY domain-containing protein n=1 Tax=Hericium alpestre TaxID=135208 RepID=A0A4Y9ZVR3_9AGAM|nr:hypothetical protein EWM64_g5869 [Hericium alpestre]
MFSFLDRRSRRAQKQPYYPPPPGPPPNQFNPPDAPPPEWAAAPERSHTYGLVNEASEDDWEWAERFCKAYPMKAPGLLNSDVLERIKGPEGCGPWTMQFWSHTTDRFIGKIETDVKGIGVAGATRVRTEKGCKDCSILSNLPIVAGMYAVPPTAKGAYFEVRINKMKGVIAIGTACLPYPYFRLPGWNRLSAGLHLDDRRKFFEDPEGGRDYACPEVRAGDIVGCGYEFASGELFFTYNGARLPPAFRGIYMPRHTQDVYAALGFEGENEVEVNFGTGGFAWKEADSNYAWRVDGQVGGRLDDVQDSGSEQLPSYIESTSRKRAAPDQGGLLTGKDPTEFNPADPLRLWIIQVGIIILTSQLLSLLLRKIRQPRVIAEVLGGILLGPTAFGRIPGFSQHIFPQESQPYLSLVANIGLCLFLFLVGLEIDTAVIKRNARLSATVALAGIAIPFGLGAALAVPLYNQFIDPEKVKYTHFMLFTGVAYSITAFPVLCRILTELKLLDTTVGIVVLSAGVGNDIVGWVLLALSVALVNAGSGLTALYILLCCFGWTLFLLFPVRHAFLWLARRTGSIENGPTLVFMTITILVLFGSAFFTDVIGVHAIFGAFLAGVIVPREGGLAIALTEKLEDMVSIIFLPLYFTISGLSTDLGLLNSGEVWGFTVAICALAFTGKFGGCTIAARIAGFEWREASTIGSLMSCKGLIELIVLNVGLSAGVLTERVFSMFVLEALLLTFMTTPTVSFLYPPELRKHVTAAGSPYDNVNGRERDNETGGGESRPSITGSDVWKRRFTVVLDKIEHVPGMMALTQLVLPPPSEYSAKETEASTGRPASPKSPQVNVEIDALRLIELSDRRSAVMKSSAVDALVHTDPALAIFRMFGELNGATVVPSLAIVPAEQLAATVAAHARTTGAHIVFIPWLPPSAPVHVHAERPPTPIDEKDDRVPGPFDPIFRPGPAERPASAQHSHFIRSVFAQADMDVALFVDRGVPLTGTHQHLFLPFFGGPDDRLALEFVVQLCANPRVSATVLRVQGAAAAERIRERGGRGSWEREREFLEALRSPEAPPSANDHRESVGGWGLGTWHEEAKAKDEDDEDEGVTLEQMQADVERMVGMKAPDTPSHPETRRRMT